MAGTSEGGIKAAISRRERYGQEKMKEWSAMSSKNRKVTRGGFTDPIKGKQYASKGGKLGFRYRKIGINDKFKPEEWGLLLRLINHTAGILRLNEDDMTAIDQHNVYNKVFEYWAKEDWVGAMLKVSDHPRFVETLGTVIDKECQVYKDTVIGQSRHSDDREYFRVLRNIRGAYKVAIGVKNGK